MPKLLDFGIAKLLARRRRRATLTRSTGMRAADAGVRQPRAGAGQPRDDGERRVLARRRALRAAHRAVALSPRSRAPTRTWSRRVPRRTDPERPSAAGSDRASSAAAAPRRPRRDRAHGAPQGAGRRYPSVEQFAGDLRRHLDGLPVRARPDTFGYRAGKFVRRHRVAVAAAALVALALGRRASATRLAGARRPGRRRPAPSAGSTTSGALASAVLFDYHDAIKDLRGARPVRERLVRDALGYLDNLAQEAHGDPSLQRELAGAYQRWGISRAEVLGPRATSTAPRAAMPRRWGCWMRCFGPTARRPGPARRGVGRARAGRDRLGARGPHRCPGARPARAWPARTAGRRGT